MVCLPSGEELKPAMAVGWHGAMHGPCIAMSGDARLAYTQTPEREHQADVKVLSSGILVDWVHNASWKLPCSMQNQRSRVNPIHIVPACMHIYASALQLYLKESVEPVHIPCLT